MGGTELPADAVDALIRQLIPHARSNAARGTEWGPAA